LAKLTWRIEPQ